MHGFLRRTPHLSCVYPHSANVSGKEWGCHLKIPSSQRSENFQDSTENWVHHTAVRFARFRPFQFTQGRKTMNTKRKISILLIAGLAAAGEAAAQDQEKKIKRSDLPAAVEKTVAAQSAGATIKGFSLEKENGQIFYEVEMTVNGHTKDVLIDGNGAVVEVEEEVAVDALSPEVKAGLLAKAGKGKLTAVVTIRKHDKLVAYEAKVNTNGKKSEVQVGLDGKPLDHEE
jgi:hypothetical protein